MNIINISGLYNVSPQILPLDIITLSEKGFEKVICNRPDFEVPPDLQSKEIEKVAKEVGILFEYHPLTHDTMHSHNIEKQMEFADACKNPVLAYCASGTRCTVVWAFTSVARRLEDPSEIGHARAAWRDAPLADSAHADYGNPLHTPSF